MYHLSQKIVKPQSPCKERSETYDNKWQRYELARSRMSDILSKVRLNITETTTPASENGNCSDDTMCLLSLGLLSQSVELRSCLFLLCVDKHAY